MADQGDEAQAGAETDGQEDEGAADTAAPDHFEVVLGEGSATIDGEPVLAMGGEPLEDAILDTLRGYARVRAAAVTAVIADPSAGYTTRIEVYPDGSSRILGGQADAAEPEPDRRETPQEPDPSEPPTAVAPPTGPPPAPGAGPAPEPAPAPAPAPPPLGSLPGVTTSRRADAHASGEYEPPGIFARPWFLGAAAALVVVLSIAAASLLSGGSGASADDDGNDAERGRPTAAGFPSETNPNPSPSPSPSRTSEPSPSRASPSEKPSPSQTASDDETRTRRPEETAPPDPTHSRSDESSGDSARPTNSPRDGGGNQADTPKSPDDWERQENISPVLIYNELMGGCVDLPGTGKGKPDGPVHHNACISRGDNQRWSLDPVRDGLYLIRNLKDDLCLDLPYDGPAAATTEVTEFPCRAEHDNQLWWFHERPNGTYWIRNSVSDDLCLDVSNGAPWNGAPLTLFGCDDNDDHQWRLYRP